MSPTMQAYRAAEAARDAHSLSITLSHDGEEYWNPTSAEMAEWDRLNELCAEHYDNFTEAERNAIRLGI